MKGAIRPQTGALPETSWSIPKVWKGNTGRHAKETGRHIVPAVTVLPGSTVRCAEATIALQAVVKAASIHVVALDGYGGKGFLTEKAK